MKDKAGVRLVTGEAEAGAEGAEGWKAGGLSNLQPY